MRMQQLQCCREEPIRKHEFSLSDRHLPGRASSFERSAGFGPLHTRLRRAAYRPGALAHWMATACRFS